MRFKLTLLLLLAGLALNAISEDAGTSGFSFLKISYSARAAALGNTYTGLSNTADAAFFNPAGLTQVTTNHLNTTYTNYLEGFSGGSLAWAKPYNSTTGLGVFCQFLTSGEIDKTVAGSDNSWYKSGTYSSSNMVFGVAAGHKFNEIIDLGATAKIAYDTIDGNSASALAVDLGLLHQTTNDKVKLGVALRNLGVQLSSYTDANYEEKLPLTALAGVAWYYNPKTTFVADVYYPLKEEFSIRVGAEYQLHPLFTLRGGYRTDADDWKMGGDYDAFSGFSTGFATKWREYVLDYAVNSYGDLGFVHFVSVGYQF